MSASAASLVASYTKRGRSWADLALNWFLALLTVVLLGTILFLLTGGKALIVRSGSMEPSIGVGDIVVTRTVEATLVREGDVITFSDPTRSGELVTHRAKEIEWQKSRISFVTKGDANGAEERWTIARDGTVGKLMFSIPSVGYGVSWVGEPATRFGLLVAGGLLLIYSALRKIWAS